MSYHTYYLSTYAFSTIIGEKLRSYIRIGVATSGYHRRAVMVNNFNSGTLYLTSFMEGERYLGLCMSAVSADEISG